MISLTKKIFPFLDWGPLINKKSLQADFVAGLAVALVLVPQSMAYAQLAGMPPVYGLYAALIPSLVGVLWGSSYHLGTGPVAMTSLLTMATVMQFSGGKSDFIGSARYIELAILLAFLVGVIRLLVGVFKLTFFINFLSQPVIRSFVNAGVLIIASSQISKLFGIKMYSSGFFLRDLWDIVVRFPTEFHYPTFLIGALSILIIWFLKRYFPKFPSALVVVVLGSLAVKYLNLADPRNVDVAFKGLVAEGQRFVPVVGTILAKLPKIQAPAIDIDTILQMIPGAFVVMFIGFVEVTSVVKVVSTKSKQKIDLDQELIGQGLSAIAGSFSGSFPTSGSFARTALNFSSGGKTGVSNVFAALFVLISLLYLTPFLIYLPQAVLAAIIIMAVIGLIDFQTVQKAWRINKHDGITSGVTFITALLFAPNITNGIIIGGLLALVLHLYRTMSPSVSIFSSIDARMVEIDSKSKIDETTEYPVMRFDGRLYFANTLHFENWVMKVIEIYSNTKKVVILCEGINGIDASGTIMLRELIENLRSINRDLLFIGMKPTVLATLHRANLIEFIGEQHLFASEQSFRKQFRD